MQEIRSGPEEVHRRPGHRRGHSHSRAAATAAVILALFCFSERESRAQETKTMWGQVEKTTTAAELPGVYVASPGVPTFSLNVTGGAQWKAYFDFQRNAASKGQVGIDYAADGTNRLYFYGGTTPYVSKWPAVQSVGDKCLHNDGAGDMTWGSCGAAANWTEAAGVIYPSTNTNHVQVGGGASASELRLMEPSGGGANYTGFVAPALAADVVYTMPTADGGAGTCLSTSGAKVLSWAACTGAAAGWQDDGAVVRLVTTTDTVAIGRADLHSTGGTFLVEKSATTAIGGDIWISNSGVNAVGSAARLAFMPDNSADSTPNISLKAIMTSASLADLVFEMWDATAFERKMTLVDYNNTQNALIIGDGTPASLCCGDALALLGTRDSHSNTTFTIYRSGTTTLGAAISVIGTTASDWVSSSVQNDFIVRGQSTLYLSSGVNGYKGYKLTETTHDWYVSDASKMDLSATRFYSSIPIYLANGTAAAPSLSFNSDVNTGMYWISADFLGLATGGSLRAGFSVSTNNGVMNLYGNGAGGTAWATGGIISSYDSSNANKNLQFAVPQVGGSTGNNGTAALPFYSFYDDEDIGMYRKSSNVLAFALSSSGYFSMSQGAFRHSYVMHTAANGAADTWSVSAIIRSEDATPDRENIAFDAGQIGPYTGNLGTAALPFYSFEDDPNTGIYSSGGDTISFSTGGTLRAEITGYAFKISGNQVVGARGAAVADAAGGATVDTEARAAINALLARLRTHGLIAP